MTSMLPDHRTPTGRGGKPALGRPLLFAILLALAAIATLLLLVAGPSLALPLAVVSAFGVMSVVVTAWAVAGPRL